MGLYRLILAYGVLASHGGFTMWGLNPGVIAVISFYLLSGYVMTALIDRYYSNLKSIPTFYADRLLRILPQYILYAGLSLAILVFGLAVSVFVTHPLNAPDIAANFALVPLNFFMFFPSVNLYVPQAWSLGLEVLFYLCFPWIVVLRLRRAAAALSICVFLAAFGGWIDSDWFGYRLLPGTLFMFLCGSWLRRADGPVDLAILLALGLGAAALLGLALTVPAWALPYNREVLLGLCVGLCAIALLSRVGGVADRVAGDLSYGVYLNHYLLIMLVQTHSGRQTLSGTEIVGVMAASTLFSLVSYTVVERPAILWRRRLRVAEAH